MDLSVIKITFALMFKISISSIISKYTKECEIKDVNVMEEDIDNIIVKLYEDLNL